MILSMKLNDFHKIILMIIPCALVQLAKFAYHNICSRTFSSLQIGNIIRNNFRIYNMGEALTINKRNSPAGKQAQG